MSYSKDFFNSLEYMHNQGEIGFGEPDLCKAFINLLSRRFYGATYCCFSLTQSNKKWMASNLDGKEKAEVGDFILVLKKDGKTKFSFWQAKNVKDVNDSYSEMHLSFSASRLQHRYMSGSRCPILLMGKDNFTAFKKNKARSFSNYLIFYREKPYFGSKDYFYNCDFSTVDNTKVVTKKKKSVTITLHNDKVEKLHTKRSGDTVFAKGFETIIECITNFQIGVELDNTNETIIRRYIDLDTIKNNIIFDDKFIKISDENLIVIDLDRIQ